MSMRAKSNDIAPPLDVARELPVTPVPRSQSEAKGNIPSIITVLLKLLYTHKKVENLVLTDKALLLTMSSQIEQSSKRKGVGLYAGNWEYVTDEEKIPEYLSVAQKIADVEGRTTRRAYAKMTSKEDARDSSTPISLTSRNEVRKSGRARNAVDYTRLLGSENNDRGIDPPEQIEERGTTPAQETNPISPSTSASSSSNRSTSMPEHPSRPSSTSTAMNTEQPERPNKSWNAIVYEVLATSETPLTFPQLVQEVKNRYPFFNSPSQVKVLKSGPKNPLYFHEAFCKGGTVNGKQTWGLMPGQFVDKKTGEVLTPQPRHTVASPRPTEQAQGTEHHSPSNSVSKPSQSHNPRSSNPRFGREILNSPEIPDSQDERATTPRPQEADGRVGQEHVPHLESPIQHTPNTIRYQAHELTDAAHGTSANAFIAISPSGHTPQPRLQGATTTGSPKKNTSTGSSPTAAAPESQNPQNLKDAVDHETSEVAVRPLSALQAAQPSTPSILSLTGESIHDSNLTPPKTVSMSIQTMHVAPPPFVPTVLGDSAATPQTTSISPAALRPSVTPLACTQQYVILSPHSSILLHDLQSDAD